MRGFGVKLAQVDAPAARGEQDELAFGHGVFFSGSIPRQCLQKINRNFQYHIPIRVL
jgi:hypothetical protein